MAMPSGSHETAPTPAWSGGHLAREMNRRPLVTYIDAAAPATAEPANAPVHEFPPEIFDVEPESAPPAPWPATILALLACGAGAAALTSAFATWALVAAGIAALLGVLTLIVLLQQPD